MLLRNEGAILPLAPATRVAVIGDFAETPRYQGAGSSLVNATRLSTPLEALRASSLDVVSYSPGFERDGTANEALASQAADAAMGADVVLLYLGLDEVAESEGKDREHLRLHTAQPGPADAPARRDRSHRRGAVGRLRGGDAVGRERRRRPPRLPGRPGGCRGHRGPADGRRKPVGSPCRDVPARARGHPYRLLVPRDRHVRRVPRGTVCGLPVLRDRRGRRALPVRLRAQAYTTFGYADLAVTDAGATFAVTNTGDVPAADVAQPVRAPRLGRRDSSRDRGSRASARCTSSLARPPG
ncbi:hypothetical protein GCM10025876_09690 [Demequina litorisediminis]|uniref:Glycoside hydrolase family 3 C-terminal domain-containing protein n=1 Tax=Demequina litorisediminis TaxID=1849022 RepID=A0ABQ6IAB1_9MICO|nr:hypothetical protein GCM10025876_09690 [Demequina litorisediminis]